MFSGSMVRKDFPLLAQKINGKSLVYLDSAATSQKPRIVIDTLVHYYTTMNANTHSGIHELAQRATVAYETTRRHVASFIHARCEREIIFTKGATESINLVATGWAAKHLKRGDEMVVTELEHHSNIVCWQELVRKKGIKLVIAPIASDGSLDMSRMERCIGKRTKLVCVTMLSNAIGTLVPVDRIVRIAHRFGARVLLDGAQAVAHMPVDVQKFNCDFMAFSAHKMLGPMGLGILYVKSECVEEMEPLIYGGDMVLSVERARSTFREPPWRFEGGTQNGAAVIAFDEALSYLERCGMDRIRTHSDDMRAYAIERFTRHGRVKIIGPSNGASAILSFVVDGIHPHDLASVFDAHGVAIRAGHHCAQPLMRALGVSATARMSFYLYTIRQDIEKAEQALCSALDLFK